jgi:hypothetical protein
MADDDATVQRQRLLEGWLPLAQDANLLYGWQLDGAALEALIIAAAPALQAAASPLAARAALFWQRVRERQGDTVTG